jgi:hypothetical protein
MNDEIRTDVLMLLGISTPTEAQSGIIALLIDDTVEAVRAYCRLAFVPNQLNSLIAQMVARQYRQAGYGTEDTPTDIKSISEGQRSISFSARDLSGMLNDYRSRLKPYINRKGRVPSEVQYTVGNIPTDV